MKKKPIKTKTKSIEREQNPDFESIKKRFSKKIKHILILLISLKICS